MHLHRFVEDRLVHPDRKHRVVQGDDLAGAVDQHVAVSAHQVIGLLIALAPRPEPNHSCQTRRNTQ
jgi:hypothetical protein